jgi:hypothetical protein
MTFKCLKDLAPTYLSEMFKQRSQLHNCNTRSKDVRCKLHFIKFYIVLYTEP